MHRPSCLHRFATDRRGASLVEYLICVGAVALIAIAGFRVAGGRVDDKAAAQAACVQSLSCDAAVTVSAATGVNTGEAGLAVSGTTAGEAGSGAAPSRSLLDRALDVGRGLIVDGLWGTITGLWDVVTRPVETVQGLWYAVTHPITTATALKDAVVDAWNENPERLVGQAIFEVVTLPVAALKGAKATQLARAARVVDAVEAGDDAADAARIARLQASRRTTTDLAALPGRIVRADPGTVEARRALALEALMSGPPAMTLERALSHMRGIDFTRPVELVEIGPADELIQYNLPGQTGRYFAPRGTPAESLGIDPAGRVTDVFRGPDEGIVALRTTAADIEDFVDRNGNVVRGGSGGGVQYKVPDSSGFRRVP
jgi:Flp pilus assembly pilin Flp